MKKVNLLLILLIVFAVFVCATGTANALSAKYVGNTVVDLEWREYGSTDFSKYELYRDGSLIHTELDRSTTFYRNRGLAKGVTYDYEIEIYNATGVLMQTDTQTVTTGNVHGTITRDTTWTVATSPYTLTRYGVTVEKDAILTIQPGVTVNSGSYGISFHSSEKLELEEVTFNGGGVWLDKVGYCSIKNCVFDGTTAPSSGTGIYIQGALRDNSIIGNNAVKNYRMGIYLDMASNSMLTDNTASNNELGISLFDSCNNTLTGNTASDNSGGGISLYGSSDYNMLTDNIANSNNWYGIELWDSSNYNTLTNNTASDNSEYGFSLSYFSSHNTLTNNIAANNILYGIHISSSNDNLIYNNFFSNANNAYDDGSNVWNIEKTSGTSIVGGPYLGGNCWSDYYGDDLDGDCLGDTQTPYTCSGGIEHGGDYLPLVCKPTVEISTDKEVYSPGETMTVTVTFKNPQLDDFDTYFVQAIRTVPGHWRVVNVEPITLPAQSEESHDYYFDIGDWGPKGFNAQYGVALLFEMTKPYKEKIISKDIADWRYVPLAGAEVHGEMEVVPEEIVSEIIESFGGTRLSNETISAEAVEEIMGNGER